MDPEGLLHLLFDGFRRQKDESIGKLLHEPTPSLGGRIFEGGLTKGERRWEGTKEENKSPRYQARSWNAQSIGSHEAGGDMLNRGENPVANRGLLIEFQRVI